MTGTASEWSPRGSEVHAYLDNALLLDHNDRTFNGGYVGLWTKADSVDALRISGAAPESHRP